MSINLGDSNGPQQNSGGGDVGCWKTNKRKADDEDGQPHSFNNSVLSASFSSSSHAESASARESANITITKGDRMIAKDLLSLSLAERQRVYEQIHGVDEVMEETDQLIATGMDLLHRELTRSRRRKDQAIDKVAFLKPSLLKNQAFLLLFLRCEEFDGIKAGERLMNFFDFVLEHFGLNGLLMVDQWTMSNKDDHHRFLTSRDMEMLRLGTLQPFPDTRDQSGRPIMIYSGHTSEYDYESLIRAHTYLCMAFLRNSIDAQRRGTVCIVWRVGSKGHIPSVTPSTLSAGLAFHSAIPLKLSALHYCYDDPKFGPILEFAKQIIGKKNRVRFRTHHGSLLECTYQLMSFGINMNKLPLGNEGEILQGPFQDYLDWLRAREEQQLEPTLMRMIVPKDQDILLGRGKPYWQFSGNQRFHQMIKDQCEEYSTMRRHEKIAFCRLWTKELIEQQGIRFLKRNDNDTWQQVSFEECVNKVVTSFRNKPVLDRYHAERVWQQQQHRQDDESDDDESHEHNI